jgi:energy-coupling factor transporter ATP-binding protein EcfA2
LDGVRDEMASLRITSVSFKHYKAFSKFQIALQEFNVLVGPNNAGKSTLIGAFRILAEGLRRARARSAVPLDVDGITTWGHHLNLGDLSVASENIFHNYDDSVPAEIRFRLSNGNHLRLHFPERETCYLIPESQKKVAVTPSAFKTNFDVEVGFVPILGPVEQHELLYQEPAARQALFTNRASRNFRNIWYHYPADFDEFRDLVVRTWPGMDILRPEINAESGKPTLTMFCPEERFPREICWSGYGFQVWCQMLTFIVKAKDASVLVIDEPDIYLHADLQRQLVALLRDLGPDIVLATHSPEIISEAEPTSLLNVNKKNASARRLGDVSQVKRVFATLGSNLNPTLTQLAKTRRVMFVEGTDFQVLAAFARVLGQTHIANRSDFAVVQLEGFNPKRMVDIAEGIELTLGSKVTRAVVLDRDYRSFEEVSEVEAALRKEAVLVHVHPCKEIENYLLDVGALTLAVQERIHERQKRGTSPGTCPDIALMLEEIASELRSDVMAQFMAKRTDYLKRGSPKLDLVTSNAAAIKDFEEKWTSPQSRIKILPGKEVLARLNGRLQKVASVSVSELQVVSHFEKAGVPNDVVKLLDLIEGFRTKTSGQD